MRFTILFGATVCIAQAMTGHDSTTSPSQVQLIRDYTSSPDSFFSASNWEYFDSSDPTHGVMSYVNQALAYSKGLVRYAAATADARRVNATTLGAAVYLGLAQSRSVGQYSSVRLQSKHVYSPGTLLIADVQRLPSACGTWPALWMVNTAETWPAGGEVDIVENVNGANFNTMTLHTGLGCSISPVSSTGHAASSNCDSASTTNNSGCSILASPSDKSFGATFNEAGGGIFAAHWLKSGFKIWFWSASDPSQYPETILSMQPDPREFGTPVANFAGSECDWSKSFYEMSIVINTALCGDWAGSELAWQTSGCRERTKKETCRAFVESASHEDLADSHWIIQTLRTFAISTLQ